MANYEFTRLADVEVVETVSDTANVLIEENGEIKKVAKTQVGGADGGASAPVAFYISSDGLHKDSYNGELAEIQEVVDAYFSGNAYVWASNQSVSVPEKITGFGISGTTSYAKFMSATQSGISSADMKFTPEELSEAISAYFV